MDFGGSHFMVRVVLSASGWGIMGLNQSGFRSLVLIALA